MRKRLIGLAAGALLAYMILTQPAVTAGWVQDLLKLLQDGASALATFLETLFGR